MKTRNLFLVAFLAVILATQANAENYSITWSSMDGGGGASAGGQYSLSGTVGQFDAGAEMAGGPFSLLGGFWALPIQVQIEGGPTLTITLTSNQGVRLSWTPVPSGFVLQESAVVTPESWTDSPSGASNPVILSAGSAAKYFRLRKP